MLKKIAILFSGGAAAKFLVLLITPVLTRLYEPGHFGDLVVLTSVVGIYSVVATGMFEMAIPLPRRPADAVNIACLAFIWLLFAIVLLLIVRGLLLALVPQVVFDVDGLIYALPLAVALTGSYQIITKWALRRGNLVAVAKSSVLQALATSGLQVALSSFGAAGLVFGYVGGLLVAMLLVCSATVKVGYSKMFAFSTMRRQMSAYRKFPLFSAPAALLNALNTLGAPIMFAAFYGPTYAGLYGLAHRVLSVPIATLANSISGVFIAESAKAARRGELPQMVDGLTRKLSTAAIVPAVVLVCCGEKIFGGIFGEGWAKAGLYAQFLAPWLFMKFQWSPLSIVVHVVGMQRLGLILQTLTLVVVYGLTGLAHVAYLSADITVAVYASSIFVMYVIRFFIFLRKLGVDWAKAAFYQIQIVLLAAIFAAPVILAIQSGELSVIVSVTASYLVGATLFGLFFMLILEFLKVIWAEAS